VISNALEQTTSASPPTYIDVLKYVAAILAAVVAVTRAIPQIYSYLSRRRATIYQTYRLRIFLLDQPAPWRNFEEHPKKWASESYRRRYFRAYSISFGILALFVVANSVVLIIYVRSSSYSLSDSTWVYIAAAFYGLASVVLIKWSLDFSRADYRQWSPSKRETAFTVVGSKEDVLQHCCIALNSMGARIVKFDEEQGTIAASRGLWVRNLWAGQRILVSVSRCQRQTDHVMVAVSSDHCNPTIISRPSPNGRNLERFANQWIFSKARVTR
jgi:hypothetical protein